MFLYQPVRRIKQPFNKNSAGCLQSMPIIVIDNRTVILELQEQGLGSIHLPKAGLSPLVFFFVLLRGKRTKTLENFKAPHKPPLPPNFRPTRLCSLLPFFHKKYFCRQPSAVSRQPSAISPFKSTDLAYNPTVYSKKCHLCLNNTYYCNRQQDGNPGITRARARVDSSANGRFESPSFFCSKSSKSVLLHFFVTNQ